MYLDHFEVPARNVDRQVEFLRRVFGWEPDAKPQAGYLRLRTPTLEAGQSVRVGVVERSGQDLLPSPMPVVRVSGESLEECLKRVAAAGGAVTMSPHEVGESGRFARFKDPENCEWGLWEKR